MSVFVSPQDYILMANECQQLTCEICGHQYKMWCKKDKIEQANYIIDKIKPLIEKVASKNQVLSFEKILFISMIELLAKDKDFQIEKQETELQQPTVQNQTEFDEKLIKQKEELIDEFKTILQQINQALDE